MPIPTPLSSTDMFVNLVSRAIRTGARAGTDREPFIAGRVSGFTEAAAMVSHMAFGNDYEASKRRIRLLVKDVRQSWSITERQDAERVAEEAGVILRQVLLVEVV